MKTLKLFFLCLILLFVSTSFCEADVPQFNVNQSYELSDLILWFAPNQGSNKPFLKWEIRDRADNIYWDRMNFNAPQTLYCSSLLTGHAGMLINGHSNQQIIQGRENGRLVRTQIEYGFPAVINIRARVSLQPTMVEINVGMPPIDLQKLITGSPGEFNFGAYLNSRGIYSEQIWSHGNSGCGETGWKVTANGKDPVWILCRTIHYLNVNDGSTMLEIFYNLDDAVRDSNATHFWPNN